MTVVWETSAKSQTRSHVFVPMPNPDRRVSLCGAITLNIETREYTGESGKPRCKNCQRLLALEMKS